MIDREYWLNGWPRIGINVLMGTTLHCAGCGRHQGITTVAFPEGWKPPGPEPIWPFNESNCPLCIMTELNQPIDKLTARALLLKKRDG